MQRLKIFKIEGCTPHKSGKIRACETRSNSKKESQTCGKKRKMAPYRIQAEKPLEDQKNCREEWSNSHQAVRQEKANGHNRTERQRQSSRTGLKGKWQSFKEQTNHEMTKTSSRSKQMEHNGLGLDQRCCTCAIMLAQIDKQTNKQMSNDGSVWGKAELIINEARKTCYTISARDR